MAIRENLIAYYKLDDSSGDAIDAHGSNDLTVNGGTTQGATGKINDAYTFDGSDDQLRSATNPLSGITNGDFSINCWVNSNDVTQSSKYAIQLGDDIAGISDSFINLGLSESKVRGQGKWTGAVEIILTDGTVEDDTWYMITLVRDGNTWRLYLNGSEVVYGTKTNSFTNLFDDGKVSIGADTRDTPLKVFDGEVDEVGVWDKKLTTDEITSLYNSGDGLAYPFGAVNFTENLSESFSFSDNLITSGNITIALAETLNLNDSIGSVADYNRLLTDSQTIIDSLSDQTGFNVLLNELQNITDNLSRELQFNINLDDTVTMSDSLSDTLAGFTNILSKIFKLGQSSFDGTLIKEDKLIELGKISDIELTKEDETIKLKKGGVLKI